MSSQQLRQQHSGSGQMRCAFIVDVPCEWKWKFIRIKVHSKFHKFNEKVKIWALDFASRQQLHGSNYVRIVWTSMAAGSPLVLLKSLGFGCTL